MSERNYYVICDDNCKFPAMSKEQTLAAIAEATGKTVAGVDSAFITKIKELNTGKELAFWVGKQAEYNEQKDIIPNNTYVIITDDTTAEDINNAIVAVRAGIQANAENINKQKQRIVYEGERTTTAPVDFYTMYYRQRAITVCLDQVNDGEFSEVVTFTHLKNTYSEDENGNGIWTTTSKILVSYSEYYELTIKTYFATKKGEAEVRHTTNGAGVSTVLKSINRVSVLTDERGA